MKNDTRSAGDFQRNHNRIQTNRNLSITPLVSFHLRSYMKVLTITCEGIKLGYQKQRILDRKLIIPRLLPRVNYQAFKLYKLKQFTTWTEFMNALS